MVLPGDFTPRGPTQDTPSRLRPLTLLWEIPKVKLVAQFGNEIVATNLSGDEIANLKVKIGSRELRLYEIRRIEKRDSLSIVTTVAGKKYAGQVTGLPELSGPSNAPVDATDADHLDFYAVDLGPLEVDYEVVASRNQMPLSKISGVLELKSIPFTEPVEPIQQFADPFSPNLDSFLRHAMVDGRSDLYVTETGLVWEHFSWNAPGEQDAKGSYVTVDGRKWYLEWQENTGERKTSISNQFPLKLGIADWEAVVISVQLNPQSPHDESRGKVTQRSNDRGIVVTIDDTVGGHSYYTILFRKRQFSEKALPRNGPPRTGRWTFEQTEENRIHDKSGQGNHGLLLRAAADKAIVDLKNGAALNVTGKASVDLNQIGDFERTDAFSYGAWIKPKPGGSSPLAKMADSGSFQGYDIMLDKEKVFVHLVHSWYEGSAIKVGTTAQLKYDTWQHVMVTYDGSSKAAGVKIYLNGEVVETTVEADALTGSIRTVDPLQIGSRRGGMQYHGLITDVRIVDKELTAEQVREIAENRPE